MDHRRQMFNVHFAVLLQLVNARGLRVIGWKVKNGGCGDFRIYDGVTASHGPSQRIPARVNVVEDRPYTVLGRDGWRGLLSQCRARKSAKNQSEYDKSQV
jgi:hypothetical protein